MGRILIADDHDALRRGLARGLAEAGHEVEEASNGNLAIERLHDSYFDVVLSDLKMGGSDGMDVLRTTRAMHPTTAVILMTAFGSVNTAVEAMKIGAFDYVQKPFEIEEMEVKIDKALEMRRLKHELEYLRGTQQDIYEFDKIVGSSAALQHVLDIVKKVAKSNTTVLIRGETGTGKELIAGATHHNSLRASRNFVKVNCAALQENLLESELFGHEKGAFTGADKQRIGRFEQADGGTLFLDEIGDMSPSTQAKILRVLQEHEFERLGGTRTLRVDVRLIAATNRDLSGHGAVGPFPRGSLLPLERGVDRDAAAARAERRHRAAGAELHQEVRRRIEEEDRRDRARSAEAADALQLARQHPRAREHHRAGDSARRRTRDRPD
jgi:two-component system, NtrC family, response regulator HydG